MNNSNNTMDNNMLRPLIPIMQNDLQEPYIIKVSENYEDHIQISKYSIPCAVGFGHTIGNSIRRTCLTNLTGYAIVAVKLNHAKHAFDILPGILETMEDVMINLKQICVRLNNNITHLNLKLNKTNDTNEEMIITAADFEENENVKISNLNQYICTLDIKTNLKMEIIIAFGRGYIMAEKQKFNQPTREFIPMDSIFSPVIQCGYDVQCFTGGKTNYDNLEIILKTNGTHTTDEVIQMTIEILYKAFKSICTLELKEEENDNAHKKNIINNNNSIVNSTDYISMTDLSVRVKNRLSQNEINTVADLAALTKQQVLALGGLGDVCITEIETFLSARGLCFGMNLNNSTFSTINNNVFSLNRGK